METFFVPYSGDRPAAVEINGHRVLILSPDIDNMSEEIQMVGGDRIREIAVPEHDEGSTPFVLEDLAHDIKGGIVLSPPGVSLTAMIESLEDELPWIH